jgi:hypothetical protein
MIFWTVVTSDNTEGQSSILRLPRRSLVLRKDVFYRRNNAIRSKNLTIVDHKAEKEVFLARSKSVSFHSELSLNDKALAGNVTRLHYKAGSNSDGFLQVSTPPSSRQI